MARPRSIAEEDVLETALRLFWQQGYDNTSIADLSAAIGVGPSSLYNTFGSKEELFKRAMDRYMSTHAAFTGAILAGNHSLPADEAVGKLLKGLVNLYTVSDLPPGCAILQSGGAGAPEDSPACAVTWRLKQGLERSLKGLFSSRKQQGDLLAAAPATLAKFVVATMRGLSQLACDGTSRAELQRIARHAANSCVVSS